MYMISILLNFSIQVLQYSRVSLLFFCIDVLIPFCTTVVQYLFASSYLPNYHTSTYNFVVSTHYSRVLVVQQLRRRFTKILCHCVTQKTVFIFLAFFRLGNEFYIFWAEVTGNGQESKRKRDFVRCNITSEESSSRNTNIWTIIDWVTVIYRIAKTATNRVQHRELHRKRYIMT